MEFIELVRTYDEIEKTSARLSIMEHCARLFARATPVEAQHIVYLSQGIVAPPYEGIEVGIGERLASEALAHATGYSPAEIAEQYRRKGDLGTVAALLLEHKKQTSLAHEPLTVSRVFTSLKTIALAKGPKSQSQKLMLLVQLLNDATPEEGKFIIRFVIGKLRLGLGDATIIDALSVYLTGDKRVRDEIERAYNRCSDLGFVARQVVEKKAVVDVPLRPGVPLRPALAERLSTPEEIIEKIGPCYADAKYDGFRCQIHKQGSEVTIFSRKLERTTAMFPELARAVQELPIHTLIVEGEALAYREDTHTFYPFQLTIQRKRKYDIERMQAQYPLKLFVFDILYKDGEDFTNLPYEERRKQLEQLFRTTQLPPLSARHIALSQVVFVQTAQELEAFFDSCVTHGLEGIIAKDPRAPYTAGARKFAWIKLKRSYAVADTIDAVIVGYFTGKGKRTTFGLGGILVAVYDEEEDRYKTVAKVGSGFSEEEMVRLKELLDGVARKEKHPRVDSLIEADVWTDLVYVVSITADEITKSPLHTAGRVQDTGYALRFPRLSALRTDKSPQEVTTVSEIIDLYEMQNVRNASPSSPSLSNGNEREERKRTV